MKGLEKIMKKSTFGLLAATALIFTPVAAFAQDAQQNLQINNSNAAAAGGGNFINQTTHQASDQTQLSIDGYGYYEPSTQTSVQDNRSDASAIGGYNVINQGVGQDNSQYNSDIDSYPAYYPGY